MSFWKIKWHTKKAGLLPAFFISENYLEQVLRETDDSDPLMISTAQDCLLDLYIRSEQYKKAFDIYKNAVSADQAGM